MSSYASQRRDYAVANQASEDFDTDAKMRCGASGCPNRWSVDGGSGRLCSAHAWADAKQWPSITREQQAREADRAMYGSTTSRPVRTVSKAEALEKLATLRINEPKDPLDWARKLKARDEAGERLTPAQREMYQAALRRNQTPEAA